MPRLLRSPRRGALPLLLLLASLATAQDAPIGPPALPPRPSREATWPAPTAEDWARPCLIAWQRSWADALAVSKETGKPILVCVNMDGEIASEHYAGVRYRQPGIAALYERYVCVIASVYRHTPRDHDEHGARIPCPRFGSVTCGEHIAIEPGLYEGFFEGQRVAPRHVGVELDGREMYDVFYAWSTEAVFDAIRTGVADRPPPPPPSQVERSPLELLDSRDGLDRSRVEAAFAQGDAATRRALLEAVVARADEPPLELLRLALQDPDPALAALARSALARAATAEAVELILQALGRLTDPGAREPLLAALERIGAGSPRARTLAIAYRGLAAPSRDVDVEGWTRSLAGEAGTPPAVVAARRAERLAAQDEILLGDDAQAHVELAEALLAQADGESDRESARYLRLDARRAAQEAQRLGAYGPRVNAALALADAHLGDRDAALALAGSAAGLVPDDPGGRDAMLLLALFAQSRLSAIADASRARADWPAAWLSDVHAAYEVLARHPFGDDEQVLMHHDLLRWFGASATAAEVLDAGLRRFPGSPRLHDRLRAQLLESGSVLGLEAAYEQRLAAPDAPPCLSGFAGYAALVAAEYQRRAGHPDEALAAYERGIAHYERSLQLDADGRADAEHYIAMALAGEARVVLEQGDAPRAVERLLLSFARKPSAAATLDGLSVSAVDTARLLLARLSSEGPEELRARLEQALDGLDAALLLPPVFERGQPGEASPGARPGPRRGD